MKKLVLIVALVGMLWIFWQQRSVVKNPEQDIVRSQEYMHEISMVSYTPTGTIKQMINAHSWEFIPLEKKSNVIEPHVIVYKPNGDIWDIKAQSAYAWQESLQDKVEQVDLIDQVVMQRACNSKYTPTKITSNAIAYYPLQEKITSESQVNLEQPDLYISGVGMIGYLDKHWIKLNERTTTIHDQHTINSKELEFDDNNGTALYKNNVTVKNNDSSLQSDALKIVRDGSNSNKIKTMIAYGSPAIYTKEGDSIEGPILTYDMTHETLHTQRSTVTLQPKQER